MKHKTQKLKKYFLNKKASRSKLHASGFTLLLSVLIVSVVLSVALSAYNLIIGETLISSGALNSQISFYAAFSGLECARYWELEHPNDPDESAFATSTQSSLAIFCEGQTITPVITGGNPTTHFELQYANNSCAKVDVTKTGQHEQVEINVQGQNTPCPEQTGRTVQRGLLDIF